MANFIKTKHGITVGFTDIFGDNRGFIMSIGDAISFYQYMHKEIGEEVELLSSKIKLKEEPIPVNESGAAT